MKKASFETMRWDVELIINQEDLPTMLISSEETLRRGTHGGEHAPGRREMSTGENPGFLWEKWDFAMGAQPRASALAGRACSSVFRPSNYARNSADDTGEFAAGRLGS
jgi:hypothetical protein